MRIAPTAALFCLFVPGVALAQAAPEWLDRMAAERNAARAADAALPPVVPPKVPPQRLDPLGEPLVCRSAARAWLPIRRDPSPGSPVVGYTQPQVAEAPGASGGFVRVKLYNGRGYGYLPREQVGPYSDPERPNQTCAVAGTRPGTGAPVFSYDE